MVSGGSAIENATTCVLGVNAYGFYESCGFRCDAGVYFYITFTHTHTPPPTHTHTQIVAICFFEQAHIEMFAPHSLVRTCIYIYESFYSHHQLTVCMRPTYCS